MSLDPITIPVLMKVLDFFFDQGSKILEQRRKQKTQEKTNTITVSETDSFDAKSSERIIVSKDEVIKQKVVEKKISANLSRLEHLLEIKEIYTRRYELARKKMSILGEADVPYKILHEIDECEQEIAKIMEELKQILSNVFDKNIDDIELLSYRKNN